ncbi:MAG: hypothetical protein A2270_03245 [Elusimicrobia bacterium RIFOXYA12_FULL_51_18]|nr:MAG: hypothetical protein A2270_03245 [Elusimicrobia bacterium RIFOXYA12_FULL_51_18]OGS31863.1 MAG: hypothetical protein A2218_06210 [Elusimicrobia bacterium RIFOXYA2_FULL_53_38]
MYRSDKSINPLLFPKLFNLGVRLDYGNRWLKLAEVMPWDKLDEIYSRYFSLGQGRPAKDSRLICGLLVVKLVKNMSDDDAVQEFMENPYIQAFCGSEYFAVEDVISSSVLSERRKRLGEDFFNFFDSEVPRVLKDSKAFRLKSAPREKAGFFGRLLDTVKNIFN